MQVPAADAGAKDDALQEKCEKCETLEKSLKKAELKLVRQRGELQAKTQDNGKLKESNDELKAKYTELKKITEVCGVDVCVECVCVNCCINAAELCLGTCVVIYRLVTVCACRRRRRMLGPRMPWR